MEIGAKIKMLRLELNLTQEELAKAADTTKQTIHKYETGIITNIPASKIKAMADKLGTTPAYLMGWDTNLTPPDITNDVVVFGVIGDVAAGYDHIALTDFEGDKIEIPRRYLAGRSPSDYFVLRVKGDSMYPLYIEGDKVLVLKQSCMDRSGQIGVVMYDSEFGTLKKVEYEPGHDWLKLIPINPIYPPLKIEGSDLEQCKVLGVPKLVIRSVEE